MAHRADGVGRRVQKVCLSAAAGLDLRTVSESAGVRTNFAPSGEKALPVAPSEGGRKSPGPRICAVGRPRGFTADHQSSRASATSANSITALVPVGTAHIRIYLWESLAPAVCGVGLASRSSSRSIRAGVWSGSAEHDSGHVVSPRVLVWAGRSRNGCARADGCSAPRDARRRRTLW